LGYTVKLTSKNPATDLYNWSPAATLDDPSSYAPVASPGSTTIYTLSINDPVCTNYASVFSVNVEVLANPTVTAQKANDITCTVPTSQLNAFGATTYAWSPGIGLNDPHIPNPVANIDTTATFVVVGTDPDGCFGVDSVKVVVTSTGANLFAVPNAFSPNGDGRNDCFGIQRWGDVRVEEFSIFDRWGVRIFTTRNPAECWDGSFRGKPQAAGVYAYIIRAHSFCGEITRSGTVVLVR
jgi:gliding motility-associated-like protein